MVSLGKAGIKHWKTDSNGIPTNKQLLTRPNTVRELLFFWPESLDGIEDGYTVGDLFDLIGDIADSDDILSALFRNDVITLLSEKSLPSAHYESQVTAAAVITKAVFYERTQGLDLHFEFLGISLPPTETPNGSHKQWAMFLTPIENLAWLPLYYIPHCTIYCLDRGEDVILSARHAITFGAFVFTVISQIYTHQRIATLRANQEQGIAEIRAGKFVTLEEYERKLFRKR